jgi:hypothetical protein
MNGSHLLDPQTSEGRKVMRLAAVGLAMNPDDLARELAAHQLSPHGRVCVGCGQPWCCPLGRIAFAAHQLVEMAHQVVKSSPPSVAGVWQEFGFFDPVTDDRVVPPVLGLDNEL